jgi:hypothetical protein
MGEPKRNGHKDLKTKKEKRGHRMAKTEPNREPDKKKKVEKKLKGVKSGSRIWEAQDDPYKGKDMATITQMMRVKGVHFDRKGEVPYTLDQLLELGGLFEFRDIWDRLPQPKKRVERWIMNKTWPNVFLRLPTGPNRSTTYVNLEAFLKQVEALMAAGAGDDEGED